MHSFRMLVQLIEISSGVPHQWLGYLDPRGMEVATAVQAASGTGDGYSPRERYLAPLLVIGLWSFGLKYLGNHRRLAKASGKESFRGIQSGDTKQAVPAG